MVPAKTLPGQARHRGPQKILLLPTSAAAAQGCQAVLVTPAPAGERRTTLSCTPVKRGSGGKDAKDESASLALAVRRGRPPAHFWFLFVRAKRNSPQGETLPQEKDFVLLHTPLRLLRSHLPRPGGGLDAAPRNGVGKTRSQRRSLWITPPRTQSLKSSRAPALAPLQSALRRTAPPPGGSQGPRPGLS